MEQDELKIKLSVADRLYPLTIVPTQEEGFRKAAKKINDMIQEFETIYQLRDKQDGLAMCAITLARQRSLSTGVQRLKPNRLKHVPLHRKLTAYIDCPFGKLNINISQKGELQ